MDFGVCLPTKAKSYEVVKRAEELGATTPGSTTHTCSAPTCSLPWVLRR